MSLKDRAVRLVKNTALLPVYQAFGGLSEFWALIFGVSGIVLAFRGKLDSNFAAMIVAVQGILCAHDALDDFHSRRTRNEESPDGNPNPESLGSQRN